MSGHRDRGSASLVVLGAALAVVLLALGVVAAGGVVVARHVARNAADAAALAGAIWALDGDEAACAAAARLAGENGGRLVACAVVGPIVTVTVEVGSKTGIAAQARARAGPA